MGGTKTEEGNIHLGGTAIKPKGWDRTGFEAFKYMLYNPDTGEVLTRTPLSWLKITVFYCIYYSCLAAFWIACLQIFFLTLHDDKPRWVLKESIIGDNPGVGLRPNTSDKRIDSSLYLFKLEDTKTTPTTEYGEGDLNVDFATRMQLFLNKYDNTDNLEECSGAFDENNRKNCIFAKSVLGDCAEYPYGMTPAGGKIQPCFFLKLNRIYGFDPKPIPAADLDSNDIYETMPQHLKERVRDGNGEDEVYINCEGRFPADSEGADHQDIGLKYFPDTQAISRKYFPFYNTPNYHSPLVAVQITNAPIGQLLHIECKAWYKDVLHNRKDKLGLTQFEVMVE